MATEGKGNVWKPRQTIKDILQTLSKYALSKRPLKKAVKSKIRFLRL
jgi:hypothetical protein